MTDAKIRGREPGSGRGPFMGEPPGEGHDRVYLDHNATTTMRPEAREALVEACRWTGNASSVHGEGRHMREYLERARDALAEALGAFAARLVFVSGATEANALALHGADDIFVAEDVHDSLFQQPGAVRVPVEKTGALDREQLERRLRECRRTRPDGDVRVAISWANSETGIVQDAEAISAVCARWGAALHLDAAQMLGRLPVDAQSLIAMGVTSLGFSAHKFGGPTGIGALVCAHPGRLRPLLHGGGQERWLRAGTQNVAGAWAMAAAARGAVRDQPSLARTHQEWRREFEAGIRRPDSHGDSPNAVVGQQSPRLPNTSCLLLPPLPAHIRLIALDLEGFAVSAGSACSSGKVTHSRVLEAMGVRPDLAATALRVSLGWNSRPHDLPVLLDTLRAQSREQTSADAGTGASGIPVVSGSSAARVSG